MQILDKKGKRIKVSIIGKDGNAFAILGVVDRIMLKAGVSPEIRKDFFTEATAGNYDELLQTVMKYFEIG